MNEIRVLSLFSGIGGFDLGLERASNEHVTFRTVAFVEQDEYCQKVLRARWPGVPVFGDVRTVNASTLPACDLICGGFPCQDISVAGRGEGIRGARSGLWSEFARLIREIEPRWVLVENVSALLGRGLSVVLADLSACGLDAEWDCLPASSVGAPHQRDRVWLAAYPRGERVRLFAEREHGADAGQPALPESGDGCSPGAGDMAHARSGEERPGLRSSRARRCRRGQPGDCGGQAGVVAHPDEERLTGGRVGPRAADGGRPHAAAEGAGVGAERRRQPEPDMGGGIDGVSAWLDGSWERGIARTIRGRQPHRVPRLRALGNALVPQLSQWLGMRIVVVEMKNVSTRDEQHLDEAA